MASSRSRRPLVIGLGIVAGVACLVLVVVLILAITAGGFLFWRSSGIGTEPAPPDDGQGLVLPPGVAEGEAFLPLSESSTGPVVDVYTDFLCPPCVPLHEVQGEDLAQLAQAGEIALRVHPRPMLDANSTPPGYSGRAANASVCAYAQDPTQWFAAADALFTDQPGLDGLSDEELSRRIGDATGLDVTGCVAEGTYIPWLEQVVEVEAEETTVGTPTVLIDGELYTGDFVTPGSLKEAITAA